MISALLLHSGGTLRWLALLQLWYDTEKACEHWSMLKPLTDSHAHMLSIIIPTWNGLQYLPRCLATLRVQLPKHAEIIVVDNGSSDGTAAWVHTQYPEICVIRLPHNLGFAGGVNTGLRAARGDLIFLFNDDAFAEAGMLDTLLQAAHQHPAIGAFAAVLVFAHEPNIVASAGIRAQRDGLALDLWPGRAIHDLPTAIQPIMGASGGAALLRRSLIDDIGLFESSFFNYLEDVDFAWRALLRGWETLLVPQAHALHVYSATAGQGSHFKQRLLARNRIAAIVRCFPSKLLVQCLPAIVRYDALAIVYALVTRQPAIISGRLEAIRQLPTLLAQRHAIQAQCTAPSKHFAHWLEPARMPGETLAEQRKLEAILAQRINVETTAKR
jgi:GT2 family glycosyltransferase